MLRPSALAAPVRRAVTQWQTFHADIGTQIAIAHALVCVPALYLAIDSAVHWTGLPVPVAAQAGLTAVLYASARGRSGRQRSTAAAASRSDAGSGMLWQIRGKFVTFIMVRLMERDSPCGTRWRQASRALHRRVSMPGFIRVPATVFERSRHR